MFTMKKALCGALACVAVLAATPGHAAVQARASVASSIRSDADWSEAYFPSADGITQLHADILRPKGMPWDVRTPVILTVTPYANHNGSTSGINPLGSGPNPRFFDFLDLSGALTRGYTYVMVDLPGFGGSAGCNDWGGAREQAGVHAAVEWAASRPWSTGKVALFGKSYDGWTGLMGVAQQPQGLAAVISMEPVYSGYRYKYMNGVRRPNFAATMAAFQVYDAKPGRPTDAPVYNVNGAPQAWCYGVNIAGTVADDDEAGPYWRERNLVPTSHGKTTPVFLTQGFLETNTKQDGAFAYWNGLAGEGHRAWFGQFDHVRGWEYDTGRAGFIDEAMRFLDRHLKDIEPTIADPTVIVQDARGRHRGESRWPPADAFPFVTDLNTGSYIDDMQVSWTAGVWSISEPLPHEVWLSGEPVITVNVDAMPNANLAAHVYDIDEDGHARLISRGVTLLRGVGRRTATVTMYGQDWPIAAGHRIGVRLSAFDSEFAHVPTHTSVSIVGGNVSLPFLTFERSRFLDGWIGQSLMRTMYRGAQISGSTIAAAERPFTIPPPLEQPYAVRAR